MSKSKRPPSYLLDRPLYHSGNHSPTSSKGTIPDGDFRANEFLVRFLFQPLCTKATQNFTIGIPKLLYSGLNLLHQYLSLGKRTIIRDIPVNESYLLSFPLWTSPLQTDDRDPKNFDAVDYFRITSEKGKTSKNEVSGNGFQSLF